MSRDPWRESRLDLDEWRERPATDRVRAFMEAQESAEEHARQVAAYNRLQEAEASAMHREAAERIEILTTGRTSREIEQETANREEVRQAKIAELEEQLDRLDPARRAARQADAKVARQRAETAAALRQAHELSLDNNPFMRRMVTEFHQRGAARERQIRRAGIEQLERAMASGDHATISRVCDAAGFSIR